MTYKPWKEFERRHAKRMSGVRLWRPDFGESAPDGESDTDVWDCKALSKQAVVTLFVTCEKKYREYAGNRTFHLCLFDPTRPKAGDLVVVPADHYAELVAAAEVGRGLVEAFTEEVK